MAPLQPGEPVGETVAPVIVTRARAKTAQQTPRAVTFPARGDLGLPIGAIAMPRSDVRLRMPFRRASANMTSVSGLQGRATISATCSLGHKGNVDIAVGRGSTGGLPDSATTANRRTAAGANQKPPKPQTRGGEGNPFNANAARVSDGRSVGVG